MRHTELGLVRHLFQAKLFLRHIVICLQFCKLVCLALVYILLKT